MRRWLSYGDGQRVGLVGDKPVSGVHIDEETSLEIPAVWCAVGTISSLIAGLPLCLYRHLPDGGKREAFEHPLHAILKDAPNPNMSSVSIFETMALQVLLWGNAYCEIERDEAGRPVALWLLDASRMKVAHDSEVGTIYEYTTGTGKVYLAPYQIFHLAGPGYDGLTGLSPIRFCRESLSLTRAAERMGAAFFGNACKPAGILQSPIALSDQARENLRKSFDAIHAGSGNTGRTALLEEGVTFTPLSITQEDAQFLETRKHQITEVSRIFKISPVFLHDLDRATWANLETLNRQLLQLTLMPWLSKIQAQVRLKLLAESERQTYFAEFDVSDFLQPDKLTRNQAYAIATGNRPWMLPSEVRAEDRLDPIPGIDEPPAPPPAPPQVPHGQGDDKQQETDGNTK